MRRLAGATVLAMVGLIGVARADFGDALPNVTTDERNAFVAGRDAFSEQEGVDDGLGPVFNDVSCMNCHVGPNGAVGGSNGRIETRFGNLINGIFDALVGLGGSLIQDHGIGTEGVPKGHGCNRVTFVAEVVPPLATANTVAGRRTTPLFGLGLVDATSDDTFRLVAAEEARVSPATAGVLSSVSRIESQQVNVIGRFGWKAQNATLHIFSGDAYLNEMGITNPTFPDENCPQGNCALLQCNPVPALNDDGGDVDAFTTFMTFLAPPPRAPLAPGDAEGEQVFDRIGCASCHRATLQTGPNPSVALDRVTYHPYSDFLLHDMGALGDGITQGTASGRLMRTAPLWGLRTQTTLLHDGRAKTVTEAIAAHDGQGAAARDAFAALSAAQRRKLLAFLASL